MVKWSKRILLGLSVVGVACSPVLAARPLRGNNIAYYTAEGGVVIRGNTRSAYGVCVMPPAQAVRQRTGKGSGKAAGKGPNSVGGEVAAEGESQHDVTKLYEQSPATIYMQQGLYRICEAAANGGFDIFGQDKRGDLTVIGFEAAKYQRMIREVMRQTHGLIEAEAEAARARQLEALRALATTLTPANRDEAVRAFETVIGVESRIRDAAQKIAAAKDVDSLAPFLDDPEPRIRQAANRRLWRLEDAIALEEDKAAAAKANAETKLKEAARALEEAKAAK